ncbi:hypothetical protein B0T17DRAFT_616100 [Bombardia bombarda]|uniref:Uncharacterized protein n=1 Tax=Bombardia bombarda TaxID=252184 RepID=A0AA39XB59_9PEZI|nr:hypothetical protein B0T17DRAFT_616100 [Bombardia bombarda]
MPPTWLIRLQQAGGLSLSALFFGGTILNLFAGNIMTSRDRLSDNTPVQVSEDKRQNVFWVGSRLSVETWLVVLGFGFSLLSYGLMGSYLHFFDMWCSLRAARAPGGLDYTRYLNSQPGAPVFIGFRGFRGFVLGRYLIVALGLASSICYKFAVVDVTLRLLEHLPESQVLLRVPPLIALLDNGRTSPWLSDSPFEDSASRSFIHRSFIHTLGAWLVVMAGWADCSGTFHVSDVGMLHTREIVMVAEGFSATGDYFMTAKSHLQQNWTRIEAPGSGWVSNSNGAVMEYRIVPPGDIEIQWAEMGSWQDDETNVQSQTAQREVYKMSLNVAKITRKVSAGDCSEIVTSTASEFLLNTPILVHPTRSGRFESPILSSSTKWINAFLQDPVGNKYDLLVLIRSVMAGWGEGRGFQLVETDGIRLGHAPQPFNHAWPFNEEAYVNSSTESASLGSEGSVAMEYPFYSGVRSTTRTGSYYAAAYTFLFLGCLAYVTIGIRVLAGPPALTSWMGQHVRIWVGYTPDRF